MPGQRRGSTRLLLLMLGLVAVPAGLRAQACVGLPIERRTTAVMAEVGLQPGFTQFGARAGRRHGSSVASSLDLAHLADNRRDGFSADDRRATAQALNGTLVYSFLVDNLPLCSFAGLRYTRSSSTFDGWYYGEGEERTVRITDFSSGTLVTFGLGTGVETWIGGGVFVVPYANTRIGWGSRSSRQRCSPAEVCGAGYDSHYPAEVIEIDAEVGLLLRVQRLVAGGSLRRLVLDDGEYALRPMAPTWARPWLLTLSVGVVF